MFSGRAPCAGPGGFPTDPLAARAGWTGDAPRTALGSADDVAQALPGLEGAV
ncbi:hypothetical protein ACWEGE_24545 [Amycolatopsis sp. NPDC004747]